MQADHQLRRDVKEFGATTPRVAVVDVPQADGSDAFLARISAVGNTEVCGVVLNATAGSLTSAQAAAARAAARRLEAVGLSAVLVADAKRDGAALSSAGYAGRVAATLAGALVAASRDGSEVEPAGTPVVALKKGPDLLADEVLAPLAEFGLRLRTGGLLAARAAGLSVPAYLAVGELAVHGPTTGRELERLLAVPADEIAATLRQLEQLGLALRVVGVDPPRWELTTVGREILFAPATDLARELREATSGLDADTRTALLSVLEAWSAVQERHNDRLRARLTGN